MVLLTYNEEKTIAEAVSASIKAAKKVAKKHEVVVVCYEGSTDSTNSIVKRLASKNRNIRIVMQPADQKGYGVALRMGLEAAKHDCIFYTDADNQFNIGEMPLLVPYLNDFDIVSGYRRKRQDPFGRILSAKGYKILLALLFNFRMRDVDSAFKIYKKKAISGLKIKSAGGFVDAEILIKARNRGFRIREIPVHHYPRKVGKSNYGTGFIKPVVVIDLLKEIMVLWKELRR